MTNTAESAVVVDQSRRVFNQAYSLVSPTQILEGEIKRKSIADLCP